MSAGLPRASGARCSRRWRRRAEKGAHAQAIGVSRGGRNTKVHAITDGQGRRLATRYDKLAANFLGNIHLPATIMWW